MFCSLGAHVVEADAIARELMFPGHAIYNAIVEHFGPGVVCADSSLDRRQLAELAFRQNRLSELNRIVHPIVVAAQQKWAESVFANDPHAIVMVESALVFEADREGSAPGWKQRFDSIVLVTAPGELRIARYVDRMAKAPGAAARTELEADARSRVAAQIPDSEKIPLADFVIQNDGSLDATRLQVERIFAELARAGGV
jgi:dephospho-CoA kinase